MAPANIPKVMAVSAEIVNLDKFRADLRTIEKEVAASASRISRQAAVNALKFDTKAITKQLSGISSAFGNFFRNFDARENPITHVGQQLESFGRSIRFIAFDVERLGRSLTIALTLPLVAVGTTALKTGAEFDRAMAKVNNLVVNNSKVVAFWRQELLTGLSDLGQTPQELADGLFFAASGFGALAAQHPQKVLEIVEASAKGAAIGLGDVADITRLVTGVMNAYGDKAGSAAEITLTFAKAVQEGQLEASDLVGSLGRALLLFSSFDVPFTDLVTQVAILTRVLESPSRAVTALNTTLLNLVDPSSKAAKIMGTIGITTTDVRDRIAKPGGLIDVLDELANKLPEDQFVQIFGLRSIKAAEGFTKKLREELEFSRKQIENIGSDAAGELERMFVIATDNLSGQAQIFKGEALALGVVIHDAIKQPIIDTIRQINIYISKIKELAIENPNTVRTFLAVGAALAALGPALIVAGRLAQALSVLTSIAGRTIASVGLLIGTFVNLGVAMARVAVVGALNFLKFLASIPLLAIRIGITVASMIASTLSLGVALVTQTAAIIANTAAYVADIGVKTGATGVQLALATATSILTAAVALLTGNLIPIIAILGGVVAGFASLIGILTAVAVGFGGIVTAADKVVGTLRGVRGKVGEFFSGLSKAANPWGEDLMNQYSFGIYRGAAAVIRALTYVAKLITSWLKPGSPPKILPEIDKWGALTMNEWIKGWAQADFSLFNDIADTVKGYLDSILDIEDDSERGGIVARILLGSREAIAEAIATTQRIGAVAEESIRKVLVALGVTTPALEGYIRAQLGVVAATQRLTAAQEELNRTTKLYDDLLAPIDKRLDRISQKEADHQRQLERERLQSILNDPRLPDSSRRQITLKLEALDLEERRDRIQRARDQAVEAAEQQVDAAQASLDAAQKQLEYFEGLLGLQEGQTGLMREILKAIKDAADKVEKALKEKLGEGPLFSPQDNQFPSNDELFKGEGGFQIPTPDFGDLDAELAMLQEEFNGMLEAWQGVGNAVTEKVNGWIVGLRTKWNNFKTFWNRYIGPIFITLADEGRKTWGKFIDEFGPSFDTLGRRLGTFIGAGGLGFLNFLEGLPGHIEDAGEAIHGEGGLIDDMKGLSESIGTLIEKWQEFNRQPSPPTPIADLIGAPAVPSGGPLGLAETFGNFFNLDLQPVNLAQRLIDQFTNAFEVAKTSLPILAEQFITGLSNPEIWTGGPAVEGLRQTLGGLLTNGFWGALDLLDTVWDDIVVEIVSRLVYPFDEGAREQFATAGQNFVMTVTGWASDAASGLTQFWTDAGIAWDTLWTGLSTIVSTVVADIKGYFEALIAREKVLLAGWGIALSTFYANFTVWKQNIVNKVIELKSDFDYYVDLVKDKIKEAIERVGELWEQVRDRVNDMVLKLLYFKNKVFEYFNGVKTKFDEVIGKIGEIKEAFRLWIEEQLNKIGPTITTITTALTAFGTFLTTIFKTAVETITKVVEGFVAALEAAVAAAEAWIAVRDKLNDGGNSTSSTTSTGSTPSAGGDDENDNNNSRTSLISVPSYTQLTQQLSDLVAGQNTSPTPRVSSPVVGSVESGGVVIQFGNVNINNGMDMATFEQRVRNVVLDSMRN